LLALAPQAAADVVVAAIQETWSNAGVAAIVQRANLAGEGARATG